jgi:hypothetical protein
MMCEFCFAEPATQRHHCFANTSGRRRHYGAQLMDANFNIRQAGTHCHVSHRNVPEWAIWDEYNFRIQAAAHGHQLPPPMKSYKKHSEE